MEPLLPMFHTQLSSQAPPSPQPPLRIAGLFAGIGGIEIGLHDEGHTTRLLCEIDPVASSVLKTHFPRTAFHDDIRSLEALPEIELLSAGFPCQDLSIAGQRAGIGGSQSSLVSHVFRLFDQAEPPLKWLLLENVPFMLQLHEGKGMNYLIEQLESRGLRWAYRIIDSQAFGLPHRRRRVLLLASPNENPRDVLLGVDAGAPKTATGRPPRSYGFYWTEGNRGVGWSAECVPPIKVGSGLGIPSSPAIWDSKTGIISKLDIRDIERLQGFQSGWTEPAERLGKKGERWRLVGNSVSVPLGRWIGSQLRESRTYDYRNDLPLAVDSPWPNAAWGEAGMRYSSSASMWPVDEGRPLLHEFLQHQGTPLSPRAGAGLLKRIENGTTNVPAPFLGTLRTLADIEKRRLAELESEAIKKELTKLQSAIRRTVVVSEQVELNTRIKAMEIRLQEGGEDMGSCE